MSGPQVEVEQLSALIEFGSASLLELADADVDESSAERVPERFREFQKFRRLLEVCSDGFASRCQSAADSSQLFVDFVMAVHAAALSRRARACDQVWTHSGQSRRSCAMSHARH